MPGERLLTDASLSVSGAFTMASGAESSKGIRVRAAACWSLKHVLLAPEGAWSMDTCHWAAVWASKLLAGKRGEGVNDV